MVAPAMNNRMYEHPATQANLALLRERGVDGARARQRPPRLPGRAGRRAPARAGRLLEACEALLPATPRLPPPAPPMGTGGLRVLVTAGGTREPIDGVRFVGNRSSGRMGFALAEAAPRARREVVVVAANVALRAPRRASR